MPRSGVWPTADPRLRCLKRVNRRGLAGACIEGMLSSSAEFVAVMDADLQHDESVLPRMLAVLKADRADLVVGSRYIEGGSADAFSGRRGAISRWATALTRFLTKVEIGDPMSGFFMMRRDAFEPLAPSLFAQGFKILLDIVIITARGIVCALSKNPMCSPPASTANPNPTPAWRSIFSGCCWRQAYGRRDHAAVSVLRAGGPDRSRRSSCGDEDRAGRRSIAVGGISRRPICSRPLSR